MNICCDSLKTYLKDPRVPLYYSPIERAYFLHMQAKYNSYGSLALNFCPWCCFKFPEKLGIKFYEVLEAEYNISVRDADEGKVPEEFKTDAWWKKRNL